MGARSALTVLALASACVLSHAEPAYKETFDDASWEKRWKQSSWKKDDDAAGDFKLTAGKWYGDAEADQGIQTSQDSRFYAWYSKLSKPFDNADKDLVLQFSVKHEQKIDCGGGYIKLMPSKNSDKDMAKFSGDTPYSVMFGPDICGFGTKKTHVILNHNGENHLIKREPKAETDELTHVYTLVLSPDNTYEVLIDTESVQSGSIEDDWDILKPKQIEDPDAKKPEDWDERARIEDPDDKKPDDWDDIPKTVPDTEATRPDDWDEEEDGAWEAPQKPNPEYKGEWSPKMIDNPDYKGVWKAPMIDNPEYKEDKGLYKRGPIGYVAFELWQVKAGSIFDNIILTDSKEEALQLAKDTWGKNIEGEKAMKAKVEEEEEKKRKEEEAADAANAADSDDIDDISGASIGDDDDSDATIVKDMAGAAKDEL